MDWQPIETVPMDGSEVLVSYYNDTSLTRFVGLAYPPHYGDEAEGVAATHWMPLPKPPEALTSD